ncbi:hypothetical protein ABIE27_005011 [Paenibacillus sp. 4624]|uniref:hypothetical protein n=1 Tax=Paenibacillus sp. 4624 TaxID=3156453 RepID=UPI003D1DB82B
MKTKKKLGLMVAATVLGTVAIVGFTPDLINASSESQLDTNQAQVTEEELPASLRAGHPDEIYVKDYGVFVKVDPTEISYPDENVVDNELKVTSETTAIVAYDAAYVKTRDWK